jgi:GAF domain-containing protein
MAARARRPRGKPCADANKPRVPETTIDRDLILAQARSLVAGERDAVANAANLAALVYTSVPHLNWAGFYFVRENELVLGPFQGNTACTRIGFGKGVCGTSWARRETLVVPDVHAFPGHIACDSASLSEVVVPLVRDGQVIGVLDIDSPVLARFSDDDRAFFEELAAIYTAA